MKRLFDCAAVVMAFSCLTASKPGFEKTRILHIGLYQNNRPQKVNVKAAYGNYLLLSGDSVIDTLTQGTSISATVDAGQVTVTNGSKHIRVEKLVVKPANWGSTLILQTGSTAPQKPIPDALTIRTVNNKLLCINDVFIDHYIAGVVESESGGQRLSEYYKVQSIIARTYALANLDRHMDEAFNLCDQTHCQAYHGRSMNKTIVLAATSTRGIVIVDPDIQLITAAYSSNCGGMTEDAVHLWGYPTPYLVAVKDSFCTSMPHHLWQRTVSVDTWVQWFRAHDYPVDDSTAINAIMLRCDSQRNDIFTPLDSGITCTQLRKAFGFPSAWFTVEQRDRSHLLVEGKGYGHGVGLCQEGAIKMTECGFDAPEILHHYYTNVHVISLDALEFFRAD